ncbi:ribosome maturation factor RimM [Orrella sp. JC864]|uniref:ribosome maturation factor RimM n=1 Tax=Orrella sp. JC864 TaxID=3120298 RepID=UPI0014299F4B
MTRAGERPEVPADLVELGRVVSAYGVRGWVKVQPHSSQAEVLLAARRWWLARPPAPAAGAVPACPPAGALRAVAVQSARPQGATVVAALEGVADRDQAQALRGLSVLVPRSDFPALEAGEYYWIDLIGCLVWGEDAGEPVLLGRVRGVTENGAHALLQVLRLQRQADGQLQPLLSAKGREQEILVPFVDAHLRSVDLAARRIDTDWPSDYE